MPPWFAGFFRSRALRQSEGTGLCDSLTSFEAAAFKNSLAPAVTIRVHFYLLTRWSNFPVAEAYFYFRALRGGNKN
jgi:hypothetical protein